MDGGVASVVWGVDDTVEALTGEYDLPMIAYTPYAIFSNSIPVFDINFFSPDTDTEGNVDFGQGETEIQYASESSAAILQPTIASWYITLRNIAIVGLMSVLIYIGIRIIIGAASDKAKYKERLMDWLVAICLVFVIHYIMVFIVEMSQTIGTLFATECSETILVKLPVDTKIDGQQLEADPEAGYPIWACNFIGYSRLIAGGFSDYDTMKSIEFTIIYMVLVIYTVIFTIMYLKRVLYMAFLTMIAPLVALMYPIDKINDGKAQGFDTWLKEYIFNALMQPFHMLIYTIIIGAVMDLAIDYPIYAVVALGFLIPAEKMLRKMLGFEKAQTPSNMSALGVAGAGLLMSGINKLTHRPRRSKEEGHEGRPGRDNVRMKTDDFDTIGNYASENSGASYLGASGGAGVGAGILGSGMNDNDSQIHTHDNPLASSQDPTGTGADGGMFGTGFDSSPAMSHSSVVGSDPISGAGIDPSLSSAMSRARSNTTGRNNNNSGTKKRTLRNRLGNGVMAVGTRYSRKFAKSHPLRSLRRGITYGLGAASLGMVGLAAGIASGDLGKTAQYTAAAGVVGGRLGSGIGDSLSSETRTNAQAFRQGWYGEDWQDKEREKAIREQQSDPDNVQYLRERTSNYRQILKEAYPEYARYGCTNMEDFWAAYQLEQSGASRNSAISTYRLAQRVGDVSKSPDAESKWAKKLDEEFGESAIVKAQQNAEQQRLAKQYELEQQKAEAAFEEQRKEIESSRRKNKEAELKKMQEERTKRFEELKQRHEARQAEIRTMPSQLTRSALDGVKQFYKNK